MVAGNETRTEPFTTVLANGTVPNYHNGCPETADTGQYPGLLVFKSSTLSENATTLCAGWHGDAQITEQELFIIEIPQSNPAFPKAYDKDTAFPVAGAGSTYQMHRIEIGDEFWVKGSTVSGDEDDIVICENAGLVVEPAAATTPTKWNVHSFRLLATYSGATWMLVRYVGALSIDHA
jgi:hypothetical protein